MMDDGNKILGAIASQITSLTIVYSIVYSDADQRKHHISAWLALVRGIHRGPGNSTHKRPVTRKMLNIFRVTGHLCVEFRNITVQLYLTGHVILGAVTMNIIMIIYLSEKSLTYTEDPAPVDSIYFHTLNHITRHFGDIKMWYLKYPLQCVCSYKA